MASGITLYGTAAAIVAYAAYSHWMRSKEEKSQIGFHFAASSSGEQNNTAMRLVSRLKVSGYNSNSSKIKQGIDLN